MANWLVAAHGGVGEKGGKVRKMLAPTEKFLHGVTTVPYGVELVMYTKQAEIMSMDFGWWMWYALMYGENGGEAACYGYKHKSKKNWKIVPDYRTFGDDWQDNRGNWSCGVFEIGNPTSPIKSWASADGETSKLSEILKEAKNAGVKRVYWGCCTEFI